MPRQSMSKSRHFWFTRGMGRGPDVTSNPEHDDSVVRMFTCVCGKGRESSSKNCQPGAL